MCGVTYIKVSIFENPEETNNCHLIILKGQVEEDGDDDVVIDKMVEEKEDEGVEDKPEEILSEAEEISSEEDEVRNRDVQMGR